MPAAPIVDLKSGQFRITHWRDIDNEWHEYPYSGNTKYTKEGVERLWPENFKRLMIGTQPVTALRFSGGLEYHGYGEWKTVETDNSINEDEVFEHIESGTTVIIVAYGMMKVEEGTWYPAITYRVPFNKDYPNHNNRIFTRNETAFREKFKRV